MAKPVLDECHAFFCLVFAISRIIFPQLVVAVSELAFTAIGAVAKLSEFFAELKFFFVFVRFFDFGLAGRIRPFGGNWSLGGLLGGVNAGFFDEISSVHCYHEFKEIIKTILKVNKFILSPVFSLRISNMINKINFSLKRLILFSSDGPISPFFPISSPQIEKSFHLPLVLGSFNFNRFDLYGSKTKKFR